MCSKIHEQRFFLMRNNNTFENLESNDNDTFNMIQVQQIHIVSFIDENSEESVNKFLSQNIPWKLTHNKSVASKQSLSGQFTVCYTIIIICS